MELNDKVVRVLHERIDQECQELIALETARLKESAQLRHKSVDEMFQLFKEVMGPEFKGEPIRVRPSLPFTPSVNGSRKIFRLQDATMSIIDDLGANVDIAQPLIYSELRRRHPELGERDQGALKGQIPAVLNKLASKGVIRLKEKGHGRAPNKFRKVKPAR